MALTTVKNSGLSGSIDLTSKVTGSLPVANGGTGLAAGTTDQYLKFTGTTTLASAAVASDYVLIQSQSTTSAASLSFTTSFDGTYDTHVFVVNNLEGASDGEDLYCRVLTGSGGSTENTGGYVYALQGMSANGAARTAESTSTSKIVLLPDVDNYATYKSGLTLWLGKPDEAVLKRMWWLGGVERDSAGSNTTWNGSACWTDGTGAITGMKFYMASGNFGSVTINHYGMKGS